MTDVTDYEKIQSVMDEWRANKPIVGLMGEFSSGKSTLLNFMLGQEATTTKVTATPLPPIWFTYAKKPYAVGLRADGKVEKIDIANPKDDLRETYRIIHRGLDSAILKQCDIIDAPGISDPNLGKNALRFMQPFFSFVVWCTGASQAWRQTDKIAYMKLSKTTRENSLLLITRLDKLRSDKDREKVLKRVRGETDELFRQVIGLQTPKAAAVSEEDRTDDTDSIWVKSGGYAFLEAFQTSCVDSKPAIKIVKKPEPKAVKKVTAKPVSKPKTASKKDDSGKPVDILVDALKEMKKKPQYELHSEQIEHLIAAISCDEFIVKGNASVFRAMSRVEGHDLEIDRVLSQLSKEIKAFSGTDRVRLDI